MYYIVIEGDPLDGVGGRAAAVSFVVLVFSATIGEGRWDDAGINSELPDLMCEWVKRAQTAGYGSEETAAVIKILRRGS